MWIAISAIRAAREFDDAIKKLQEGIVNMDDKRYQTGEDYMRSIVHRIQVQDCNGTAEDFAQGIMDLCDKIGKYSKVPVLQGMKIYAKGYLDHSRKNELAMNLQKVIDETKLAGYDPDEIYRGLRNRANWT